HVRTAPRPLRAGDSAGPPEGASVPRPLAWRPAEWPVGAPRRAQGPRRRAAPPPGPCGATVACCAVHRIETLDPSRLDRVEPLWLAMVAHHATVSDVPTREPADSWPRRRAQYAAWLADGVSFVLVAVREDGAAPEGYAFVRVHTGASATFQLGTPVG